MIDRLVHRRLLGGMRRRAAAAALLLLACSALPAQAATRAWLDRDSIGADESVTLNIETDQTVGAPDYAPLRADFALSDEASSRQLQMVNGKVTSKSLFGVALTPRRDGVLEIPALRVGNERTEPLRLQVAAAAPAPAGSTGADPAQIGDADVFVQTVADDTGPYVQQSVGVVVRLYLGVPLSSGELDLDTPAGASLQRVGEDSQSRREIDGRMYTVVERRFLLVPERSGPLLLPGARFKGRGPSGFFDDYFGRGGELAARSAPQTLQVRAQPANAPQPWLPLHELRLRYTATPQRAAVGEAADIVVEATARGATQAQFPELPPPSVAGAQVFAEPPQYDERFVDGSPQLKVTRRYSVVPQNPGALSVGGVRLPWWDVKAGAARIAALPDLQLQVTPGTGAPAPAPPPASVDAPATTAAADNAIAPTPRPGASRALWLWMGLAALFALLWVATMLWAWWRMRRMPRPAPAAGNGPAATAPGSARATHGLPDLRRALDGGGLDEVATVLCGMAGVADLDAVQARLDDAAQRAAVARMQRARWGGDGDLPGARAALRDAFRTGPRWRGADRRAVVDELPPLYPRDA